MNVMPIATECKKMTVGITNDGRVRLYTADTVWTEMPPEIARWIARELTAAADRVETGARIEAAKKAGM